MLKDNLHEPFQLALKEALDVCPRPEHRHSFLERVYIVSGNGKQRINDIAGELGFTDKSHLNRMFKKYKGVNPGDLRKNKQDI